VDAEPKDWRSIKKAATRSTIRRHALKLFTRHGYDNVTVDQIAGAAGVSHMTFFRYFPTKEDVVLGPDLVAQSAADLAVALGHSNPEASPLERIRTGLLELVDGIRGPSRDSLLQTSRIVAATPALRARQWEDSVARVAPLITALGIPEDDDVGGRLRAEVVVGACLAAATAAVLTWAEGNGSLELPELLRQAFEALTDDLTRLP
jgi:AcrR family transcriptional regulator